MTTCSTHVSACEIVLDVGTGQTSYWCPAGNHAVEVQLCGLCGEGPRPDAHVACQAQLRLFDCRACNNQAVQYDHSQGLCVPCKACHGGTFVP